MRAFLTRAVIVVSALFVAASVSAQTQGLARVGPTSSVHGFPTWYQDKTGVTLEFCQPQTQAELDGGWCLLLAGDTTVPEAFPSPFADEHFYFAADASIDDPRIPGGALLVLGLEAAFAVGPVVQGDQLVFARIRVRFDAPATGTYTVYHPFGVLNLEATAGERVFYTEDIGIQCPRGDFSCALAGGIGPFLLASATPGGAELPAVPGPRAGTLHIADPARTGPVTGSPINQNFFRIVGPNSLDVQTTDFSLMGRLFQGALPGRLTVDKARYASDGTSVKVDVFATAVAAAQPRVPGGQVVGAVTPILGFYPAPCGGTAPALTAPTGVSLLPMFRADTRYYGSTVLSAKPASVCVEDSTARNAAGQSAPIFANALLADQVTITQAVYDPAGGGQLTVSAASSDQSLAAPVLTDTLAGQLVDGTVTRAVGVPPLKVTVNSSAGGQAVLEVTTLEGNPSLPDVPIAVADAYVTNEDSGTIVLEVQDNDTLGGLPIPAGAIVTLGGQAATLGTATLAGDHILYTPHPNANGNDFLTYTLTYNGATSDAAFVSIRINPVNDAPVAVDDSTQGVGNIANSFNLLANDTDVDGALDLAGIVIVSAPAGATFSVLGGVLTYTAPAGLQTFTYQAVDRAGALSNVATFTADLSGSNEILTITRAEFRRNRWRVEGTSSINGGQRVFVMYQDGVFADGSPAAGTLIGSTTVAGGLFTLDFGIAGGNDPRNLDNTALFLVVPTRVIAISELGGASAPATIARR